MCVHCTLYSVLSTMYTTILFFANSPALNTKILCVHSHQTFRHCHKECDLSRISFKIYLIYLSFYRIAQMFKHYIYKYYSETKNEVYRGF